MCITFQPILVCLQSFCKQIFCKITRIKCNRRQSFVFTWNSRYSGKEEKAKTMKWKRTRSKSQFSLIFRALIQVKLKRVKIDVETMINISSIVPPLRE